MALVVDDEPILRKLGSRLLSSLGFSEVRLAPDREAAQRVLEEVSSVRGRMDFVLTDNNMPPTGGDEGVFLARKIQSGEFEGLDPFVVVYSGNFTKSNVTTPDGILMFEKPIEIAQLKELLISRGILDDES